MPRATDSNGHVHASVSHICNNQVSCQHTPDKHGCTASASHSQQATGRHRIHICRAHPPPRLASLIWHCITTPDTLWARLTETKATQHIMTACSTHPHWMQQTPASREACLEQHTSSQINVSVESASCPGRQPHNKSVLLTAQKNILRLAGCRENACCWTPALLGCC
jgi:hypothetical protein